MSCIGSDRPISGSSSISRSLAAGWRLRAGSERARETTRDDLGQIEGLRQIFECALLGGRKRRHQRVLRAHHDDRQIGPELLDARDEIEGVFVRHDDIGDDDVAFALADPAPERRRIAGGTWREARPGQSLVQNCPDGSVVIGYENGASGHIVPLGARYRGCAACVCIGSSTRNTVRLGSLSHSMMPP